MNARLLVINPQEAVQPPLEPILLLEEDGNVELYHSDWVRSLKADNLKNVTLDDVRQALRLGPEEQPFLYLSSIKELPYEDLMSPEALSWARQWWFEVVMELAQSKQIADAPAVQVAV